MLFMKNRRITEIKANNMNKIILKNTCKLNRMKSVIKNELRHNRMIPISRMRIFIEILKNRNPAYSQSP